MARNASRIKLGYYPLPPAEGARLGQLLDFAPGASAVDPCAGTGAALHQLTEGAQVSLHAVELDAARAAAATASGITTIHGNVFDTVGKAESFSFLYLNPPYDSEIASMDNKRMEYLFLEHCFRWLVEGGVLLMRHDRNRTRLLEMVWRREMPSSTRTCVASPSVCVALPRSSHASGLSCCLAAVRVFRLPE
jgi:16S rRNA G966 N2-methylase RsmD